MSSFGFEIFPLNRMNIFKSLVGILVVMFVYLAYRIQKNPKSLLLFASRLLRVFLGFKEKTIQLPGNRFPLCYMERGDPSSSSVGITKKTILFIHGFSCMKEFFSLVATHLPSREYHVLAIDLPGHGKSVIDEKADIGIPYYVNVVRKFIGTKKLTNVNLVGESMGGHVVGYYATLHPEDLSSVCMLCPHGIDFPGYEDIKKQFVKDGKHFLLPTNLDEMKITAKRGTFMSIPWPTILLRGMLQERLDREPFLSKLLKMLFTSPCDLLLENNLHKIKIPTSAIWGREDEVLGSRGMEAIRQKVPTLKESLLLEKTGHLLTLECPNIIADKLINMASCSLEKMK